MELINDPRLTPNMERVRSGRTQLFRVRQPKDNTFLSNENADVILEHENKAMYAEPIDGQWYWVNGCAECNGEPRDWTTYIECEKHDVCRTCKKPRSHFKGSVWGGKHGWQCNPCKETEDHERKVEALSRMEEEGYDEWDFYSNDKVVCPHCKHSYSPDEPIDGETEDECSVCDGQFTVEPEYSVTYTTKVIGKRLTLEDL